MVILQVMKTAISIPDDVFDAAEELAARLGVNRSELYSRAVSEYLEEHLDRVVTDRLNELYDEEGSELDPTLARMQAASVGSDDW